MSDNDYVPVRRPYVKLTFERRDAFFLALERLGNVTAAADYVGVSRVTLYKAREKNPDVAEAWDMAQDRFNAKLEEELHERIFEGVERPIFQRGELVGHEKVKSDRLLEVALRARMPDKYSERVAAKLEHSGSAGVLVVPGPMDMAAWMEKFGGAKPMPEDKPE
jgi:Bacterial regulatory protein, Fis family